MKQDEIFGSLKDQWKMPPRQVKIFTSLLGLMYMDLALHQHIECKGIRFYHYTLERKGQDPLIIITPFNKGNLYKIHCCDFNQRRFNFKFYYGTKLLFVSNNLKEVKNCK